jgi:hypothetical protein
MLNWRAIGVCLVRRIRRQIRELVEITAKKAGEAFIKNLAADKIKSIAAAAESGDWRGAAPVHLWTPPFCGDIDIEIRRDGSWWHEGRSIRRKGMAELFASVLLFNEGEYFLVTPAEKVRIRVEDCPFLLTTLRVENAGDASTQTLYLRTSLGEEVAIGAEHPLFIGADSSGNAEPHPTVNVRAGLLGLVSRSVFYQLAELVVNRADTAVESAINSALDSAVDSSVDIAVDSAAGKIGEHSTQSLGIWSSGVFFALA